MKLLKIRLRQTGNSIIYPEGFLTFSCLEHLYYDDLSTGIAWLMVAIENENLMKIKNMTDVTIIDLVEAEKISNEYNRRTEIYTDEIKIKRIDIKTRTGIALTSDELKALDPNDLTPGIGYKLTFIDKVKKRMGL